MLSDERLSAESNQVKESKDNYFSPGAEVRVLSIAP